MKKKAFFLGIPLGLILLFFTLRGVNFQKTFSLLANVDFLLIFIGLIFLGLSLFLKTWRWQLLLGDSFLPKSLLFAALTIGYLVNNLFPARLGELARVFLIGRQKGIGLVKTLGTIIAEKILDTSVLVILGLSLFFSSQTQTSSLFFFGFVLPKKWQTACQQFISTFKLFRDRKTASKLILITFFIWVLEGLWNFSLMKALGLSLPFSSALLLAVVINLGLFIPSPPGYLGVFDFLTTFTLMRLGVEKSAALSYALLQHSLEYLILSGLGLWSTLKLAFNPFNRKWQNI